MGALPHCAGVAFRVWAPHAVAVYVTGSLNEWSPESHTMIKESNDCCYADIATAAIGNEYLYRIVNGEKQMMRIDSYARQVTSSIGQSVVHDSQLPGKATISISCLSTNW
jgi:1,4-alpha-glucan branching enzyme